MSTVYHSLRNLAQTTTELLMLKQHVTTAAGVPYVQFSQISPTAHTHNSLQKTRSNRTLQWNHILLSPVIDKLFMSVQSNQLFCLSKTSQAFVAFFLLDLTGAS